MTTSNDPSPIPLKLVDAIKRTTLKDHSLGSDTAMGNNSAGTYRKIAVEALAERIPSLRPVADQQLRWSPNITFRGPAELFVDWDN